MTEGLAVDEQDGIHDGNSDSSNFSHAKDILLPLTDIFKMTEGLAVDEQDEICDGNSDNSNFYPYNEYSSASNKYFLDRLGCDLKLGMNDSSIEGETDGISNGTTICE